MNSLIFWMMVVVLCLVFVGAVLRIISVKTSSLEDMLTGVETSSLTLYQSSTKGKARIFKYRNEHTRIRYIRQDVSDVVTAERIDIFLLQDWGGYTAIFVNGELAQLRRNFKRLPVDYFSDDCWIIQEIFEEVLAVPLVVHL